MTERKSIPVLPIVKPVAKPVIKSEREWVSVPSIEQVQAERRAQSWASIYLPNIATYGGRIHHLDGGAVFIEFKDLHSAVSFITWGSLNARATFAELDKDKPCLSRVVVRIES